MSFEEMWYTIIQHQWFRCTLGCRLVSCRIVMGSGLAAVWPTMVGPKTRARLLMSILVSKLCETLRFYSIRLRFNCLTSKLSLLNIMKLGTVEVLGVHLALKQFNTIKSRWNRKIRRKGQTDLRTVWLSAHPIWMICIFQILFLISCVMTCISQLSLLVLYSGDSSS